MVKVVLYNLLRSKYGIDKIDVSSGTINEIIDEIINTYPQMKRSDFESAIVFHKGNIIHYHAFDKKIEDEEEIIITHFVGGG